MNKATLKSRATLVGKVFAEKGVTLSRAEQLELVAKLEGARGWHHANGEMKDKPLAGESVLDALQLEAAKAYCDGDFSDVTSQTEVVGKGDMLFHFVMAEIGDAKGNRLEAVNLMRQASAELENLADALDAGGEVVSAPQATDQPEAEDKLEVTDSSGKPLNWRVRYLTNRHGETEIVDAYGHSDLRAWLNANPDQLAKMWDVCLEEMAFVVELNGVRGILYEVEIETSESEGDHADGTPRCSVSEAQRRLQLQRNTAELEVEQPKLTWGISGPDGMWDGRLGVWGFCPEDRLITKDEAHTVVDSLIKKFYG